MHLRVLIVEDVIVTRELLRDYLYEAWRIHREVSVEVFEADSIDASEGIIRHRDPDVIVLDMRLADSTGFDGAARIRQWTGRAAICMLSGAIDFGDITRSVKHDLDACWQKPPDEPRRFARELAVAYLRRCRELARIVTPPKPWYKKRAAWVRLIGILTLMAGLIGAVLKWFL